MTTVVANTLSYVKTELLTDATGAAVTTKVSADWTKVATLLGVGTTVTPTITHRANGYYDISATFPTVGNWSVEYSVVVSGVTVLFDPQLVQVETAAQADAAAAITALYGALLANLDAAVSSRATPANITALQAALAAGTVTVVSPVDSLTGSVTVYQGDDQVAADSRSLQWATTSAGSWPDLTGASIVLQGNHTARGTALLATGSVVTPTGSTKQVRVELDHDVTESLHRGDYAIQVVATLGNGSIVTLVSGTDDVPVLLTVVARKGAT